MDDKAATVERAPRRRCKEARPTELIEAGLQEFAQHGFAATRLEDVARRARVANGTIYLYPEYTALEDMVGSGPFRLKAGPWTDDTAMALVLADSLLANPDLDPTDLMARFVDRRDNGNYSCTGDCFNIGNTINAALDRFLQTGDPITGSTDAHSAGNGALMRLAPVAMRHWANRERPEAAAIRDFSHEPSPPPNAFHRGVSGFAPNPDRSSLRGGLRATGHTVLGR